MSVDVNYATSFTYGDTRVTWELSRFWRKLH